MTIGNGLYVYPCLSCLQIRSGFDGLIYENWFLGSGPNRGRSPVKWGDFPFIRPFVYPFEAWLVGSEAWLAGSEAWLAGSEAWLAGSEACLAGSEA